MTTLDLVKHPRNVAQKKYTIPICIAGKDKTSLIDNATVVCGFHNVSECSPAKGKFPDHLRYRLILWRT